MKTRPLATFVPFLAASTAITTRHARRAASILLAAFVGILLGTHRAAAANDETDWAAAYEKAKRLTPGFAAESVEEFRKLTEHYASLLSDGVTVNSFELPNGDQIRCVEISTQRSLAASGSPLQLAPGTLPAENIAATPKAPGTAVDRPGAYFGLDGTKDTAGIERTCPALSFPRLMPRLQNLYQFRRLEDVFQKTQGGGSGRPARANGLIAQYESAASAPPHEYAHAYQTVNNSGMQANFNVWSPAVDAPTEFSLSQLWADRGSTSDNSHQTVETGWQNYPQLYGDTKSHLFIYSTSGNYQPGTGCYNLDCPRFVQINSTVVIGSSFTSYSTQGGVQYEIPLGFYRDPSSPHHWWLKVNGSWVGYYPNSLFNSQGLADYSAEIDFGGEIVNTSNGGLHTTTDMGSGHFPSEGLGFAAYARALQYWDLSGNLLDATGLTRQVTDASYYDLSLHSSSDATWRQYFYFGGPGRSASPTADFGFSASPKVGQPVQFTDSSTASPTSWSWAFGDGASSTAQNPSHTFSAVGLFPVSLTATNAVGASTIAKTVSVAAGSTAPQGVMLSQNRVLITVDWRNPYSGESGTAYAIPQDDKFAFFFYSDPTNPEVFVKVLDFGAGSALCFVGGLTDFYYKVTFRMVRTGQTIVFEKPAYQYIGFVDNSTLKF
ncbi:MAG: neprosin family prolyl endopeptidase [Thermoanaerobaculia bacterium]